MKKVQFGYEIRQAMQVALAVAEEIENSPRRIVNLDWKGFVRPVLLSIRGKVPTFHFEGGTVVQVHMLDMDQFTEMWRTPHCQDWVVTHVDVRYYPTTSKKVKASETWGAEKLLELKSRRPWWHPHVVALETISGTVGVFINRAAGEGYLTVDPEYNNEGYFTLYESVEYRRFVEGDLERAKAEASRALKSILAKED